jgi:hypothetical protein
METVSRITLKTLWERPQVGLNQLQRLLPDSPRKVVGTTADSLHKGIETTADGSQEVISTTSW